MSFGENRHRETKEGFKPLDGGQEFAARARRYWPFSGPAGAGETVRIGTPRIRAFRGFVFC